MRSILIIIIIIFLSSLLLIKRHEHFTPPSCSKKPPVKPIIIPVPEIIQPPPPVIKNVEITPPPETYDHMLERLEVLQTKILSVKTNISELKKNYDLILIDFKNKTDEYNNISVTTHNEWDQQFLPEITKQNKELDECKTKLNDALKKINDIKSKKGELQFKVMQTTEQLKLCYDQRNKMPNWINDANAKLFSLQKKLY